MASPSGPPAWVPGTPENEALEAAVGRVAIRHVTLDLALKMAIKSLADLTLQQAEDATQRHTSSQLRERVRKLAAKRFGEGRPLCQIDALLGRAKRATEKRNDLVHALWALSSDGTEAAIRGEKSRQWEPLPTAEEVSSLAHEIATIARDFHWARLEVDGFFYQALASTKPVHLYLTAPDE